jgi:Enoyl-CoA hydratase/isomerase
MRVTPAMTEDLALETISLDRDGHVLLIGLNRQEKRNAFDRAMLADLSRAYALLESDESVRAGMLFAHGEHFTAGLELVDVDPNIAAGDNPFPGDGRDPWRLDGIWTKPVAAAQGRCLTLGIELLLATTPPVRCRAPAKSRPRSPSGRPRSGPRRCWRRPTSPVIRVTTRRSRGSGPM